MKLLVLTIATLAWSVPQIQARIPLDLKLQQEAYSLACIIQTGVDPQVVLNSLNNVFPEDPKLAAFSYCFSQKFGMQDAMGNVNVDAIRRYQTRLHNNDQAIVDRIISECSGLTGQSPEWTAFYINKCMQQYYPQDA